MVFLLCIVSKQIITFNQPKTQCSSLYTYLITYTMQHGHSSEAKQFSASQEIPRILQNPKIHYRIHKSPPPISIPSQINPVHGSPSHFLKIHLNIILSAMPGFPSGLFPSGFPTKTLYIRFLPHTCYMPRPSHSSQFDHTNNIWRAVQIVKLLSI